jgi:hypothetical protein
MTKFVYIETRSGCFIQLKKRDFFFGPFFSKIYTYLAFWHSNPCLAFVLGQKEKIYFVFYCTIVATLSVCVCIMKAKKNQSSRLLYIFLYMSSYLMAKLQTTKLKLRFTCHQKNSGKISVSL